MGPRDCRDGVTGSSRGDKPYRGAVGLITRRPAVQICPPLLPSENGRKPNENAARPNGAGRVSGGAPIVSHRPTVGADRAGYSGYGGGL